MAATTFHGNGVFSRVVNGRETYYVKVWIPSERRTRVWKGGHTEKQAERKRKELVKNPDAAAAKRAALRRAATEAQESRKAEKAAALTLETVCKAFTDGESAFNRRILKAAMASLGDIPAASLTIRDVDRYVAARKAKRTDAGAPAVSDTTLRKEVIALRAMMRWAKSRGYVTVNPLGDIEVPAEPKREQPRAITRDEESKLLALLNPTVRDVVEFGIYSGMRRGEILAMRWRDIDRERGIVHVVPREGSGKTGTRLVPLCMSVRLPAILDRQPRRIGSDLVFAVAGGEPLDVDWVNGVLDAAMKAAGIPKQKGKLWNVLRSTASSRFYASGKAMPQDEADIFGHSMAVAVKHYREMSPASLERVAGATDSVPMGNGMGNDIPKGQDRPLSDRIQVPA